MARRPLQFTLDLFGPAAPSGTVKPSDAELKVPLVQVGPVPDAIETAAHRAAPSTFRHPRATREVLLDGKLVAYEVKRRKRRSIGFSVGAEGLAVSAPHWVPLYEIDHAVQGKSGWILKKLHETRERHHRHESARTDWKDGATFPYLGEPVSLLLDLRQAQTALQADASGQSLCVGLPADATPAQIGQAVQVWLIQQARPLFISRLDHFAPQLQVQWRKLSLSSAATRWGSASANGSIRLNWRLLHLKPAVIDYVVVHELSHLRVMDHSLRFWATVHTVMPDYADLRRQLKQEAVPLK